MFHSKNVILVIALSLFVLSSTAFADVQNNKKVGLLIGDPMAVSLTLPVKETTYLNIRAGIWTWHFWHDVKYDVPYVSVDYAWLSPLKSLPLISSAGAGIAIFLADNIKDEDDYDASAALRIPLGIDIYKKNNLTFGFEIAPIYQFLPAYSFKPYVIELNAGFVLNYSYQ